jgi:hypothetical protein
MSWLGSCRSPDELRAARLSFHQVLCLCRAVVGRHDEPAWDFVARLNEVRNRMAHHFDPGDLDDLLGSVVAKLRPDYADQLGTPVDRFRVAAEDDRPERLAPKRSGDLGHCHRHRMRLPKTSPMRMCRSSSRPRVRSAVPPVNAVGLAEVLPEETIIAAQDEMVYQRHTSGAFQRPLHFRIQARLKPVVGPYRSGVRRHTRNTCRGSRCTRVTELWSFMT